MHCVIYDNIKLHIQFLNPVDLEPYRSNKPYSKNLWQKKTLAADWYPDTRITLMDCTFKTKEIQIKTLAH